MISKDTTGANLQEFTRAVPSPLRGAERAAVRWASIEENDRVLDMDCQEGALLASLSDSMRIHACGMCRKREEARMALDFMEEADIIIGRPNDVPFRDNSFDVVFITRSAGENTSEEGLREVNRVLRAGGQLVVVCHLFDRIRGIFSSGHEEGTDRRALMRRMQQEGFKHVSCRTCGTNSVIIGWKKAAIEEI